MSDKFFIQYKHDDMNPDYTGSKSIWANDEKAAMKQMLGRNGKVGEWLTNKKGARIQITSIAKIL